MNGGKTHFTFPSVYLREWLFYDDVFVARVWMVVLFTANAVATWGAYLSKRGALSKSWSADIFGLVEGIRLLFGQMCSVSGAMNKHISTSVHECEF